MPTDDPLASRFRRLGATVIDLLALALLATLALLVTGLLEGPEAYDSVVAFCGRVIPVLLLCYLLLHGRWLFSEGQTLGKHLLGIRITAAATEEVPAAPLLVLRAFALPVLSLVPFGMAALVVDPVLIVSPSRRCLHDYLAGTTVRQAAPPQGERHAVES